MNAARWWAVVVVAVLVVAVVLIVRHRSSQPSAETRPAVKTTVVSTGVFDVRVSAHGRVGPPPGSSAALAFPVAGRVASIFTHVGDRVTAGQALVQLDLQPFELAVAQARGDAQAAAGGAGGSAAVRSAEAKLEVARANLERVQNGSSTAQSDRVAALASAQQADLKVSADEQALQRERALYSAGIAAAKDVQAAENQLAADRADAQTAQARVRTAQATTQGSLAEAQAAYTQAQADLMAAQGQATRATASLAQAERELANATLAAPNDGVVVAIFKHPGESVDPTTPVVQLGAPMQHNATLNVPAAQAASIQVGDSVELRLGKATGTYHGRVIASVPAVDPATQQATLVVSGVPPGAVAGDAVDATIVTGSRRGIIVPTSAIVQDPQSGQTLVFVSGSDQNGQRFSPRNVTLGPGDQSTTVVLGGLRPGETIAAEGAFELLTPAGGGS